MKILIRQDYIPKLKKDIINLLVNYMDDDMRGQFITTTNIKENLGKNLISILVCLFENNEKENQKETKQSTVRGDN